MMVLLLVLVLAVPDVEGLYQAAIAEQTEVIAGHVAAGDSFAQPFANRFTFHLVPLGTGWEIVIREAGREENLARLSPPWHFVPNPRDIEGWHFRNVDNTGPNDGSVNAPHSVREFVFSPEVGRTIEYEGSATPDTVVARVARYGHGRLVIVDYELTLPLEGSGLRFSE